MTSHKIGTREQWAAAREELLAREKEHTRLGDELARLRRQGQPEREVAVRESHKVIVTNSVRSPSPRRSR